MKNGFSLSSGYNLNNLSFIQYKLKIMAFKTTQYETDFHGNSKAMPLETDSGNRDIQRV